MAVMQVLPENARSISGGGWPIVAGPIALGLTLGFGSSVQAMLFHALLLLALVAGLTLALSPALYIGLSLSGAAPAASEVARAVASALCAAGLVLVGLAPATLVLVASTRSSAVIELLGMVVVGGGAVLGLRRLCELLFAGRSVGARAALVFGVWASVALLLGGKLLWRLGGVS
jgi:hypothetical protein